MSTLVLHQQDHEIAAIGPLLTPQGGYYVPVVGDTTSLVIKANQHVADSTGTTYTGTFVEDTAKPGQWYSTFTIPAANLAVLGKFFFRCRVINGLGEPQTVIGDDLIVDPGRKAQRASTTTAPVLNSMPILATPTAAVDGTGLILRTSAQWAISVGTSLSLINIDHRNLDPAAAGSEFYILDLKTDTDALDTGAAIKVRNVGHSDNIYLALEGKAGPTASAGTGIGIDVNRVNGGNTENSAANRGTAVQVWDFSETNQGPDGPRGIYLRKHNNPNTDHNLLDLHGNRRLVRMRTADGAGYDGAQPVIDLIDLNGTTLKWRLTADGDQLVRNGRGLYWTMLTGNQAYLAGVGSELQLRVGIDGMKFISNTGTPMFAVTGGGLPWWSDASLVQTTVGPAGTAAALPGAPAIWKRWVGPGGVVYVSPGWAA